MTTCACYVFKFVNDVIPDQIIGRLVAGSTLQAAVFSVEFEPCIVMIEFVGQPVIKGMAPRTIIFPQSFKLIEMNILVAVLAAFSQVRELLLYNSVILPEMTIATTNRSMFPA